MGEYIIEVIVFQGLFFLVYELLFKGETFFNTNRYYLLTAIVLSFALPFIQFEALQQAVAIEAMQQLPTVFLGEQATVTQAILKPETTSATLPILPLVWGFGAFMALVLFIIKCYRLFQIKYKGHLKNSDGIKIISLSNSTAAFSFFNTMFIGEAIPQEKREKIIAHENVHIAERHSLDLLVFEVLRIVLWFNPLVYLYQDRLRTLHEYVADYKSTASLNKRGYYESLLTEVFSTTNLSFINTFYKQSLIKKRIIMLQKSKSKSIFKLKYLAVIPLVFGMLFYVSCDSDLEAEPEVIEQTKAERIAYFANKLVEEGDLNEAEYTEFRKLVNSSNIENQNISEVIEVESLTGSKYKSYPFAKIDRVPAFPECDGDTNSKLKDCTSSKINAFVQQNFNASLGKTLGLEGVQRIVVTFKIDKQGDVANIKARAPHPDLKEEAIRVVNALPQMKPGQQDGKDVSVIYSLPIVFKIVE